MNIFQSIFCKNKVEPKIVKPEFNYLEVRNKMQSILYNYYDIEFEKWYDETKLPFNVGDIVMFDRYNIQKGNNGWDCGASYFDVRNLYPFDLKVTKVFGDKSLASEMIYKYLLNLPFDKFITKDGKIKEDGLIAGYVGYCSTRPMKFGMNLDNIFGFYIGVSYEVLDETAKSKITPFSLNSNSFLKEGTKVYKETKRLWKAETDMYFKDEKLKELRKDFELKRELFYQTTKIKLAKL
jgi:hypothetical protein